MSARKMHFVYRGDRIIRDTATVAFAVMIALLGAAMMSLTSSPLVKGAAFLWLPAALQLIAGVWLGPVRGFIAGGIGAQVAGVIAYGGWAPADFIMNLVAGGFANALLPGWLFRVFKIDPTFGGDGTQLGRASLVTLLGMFGAITLALIQMPLARAMQWGDGPWAYFLPTVAIILVTALGASYSVRIGAITAALLIIIGSCFASAAIGVVGAVVGGQSWQAAVISTGIGWFLGDSASSVLGLYVLAEFTVSARKRGIAPTLTKS